MVLPDMSLQLSVTMNLVEGKYDNTLSWKICTKRSFVMLPENGTASRKPVNPSANVTTE